MFSDKPAPDLPATAPEWRMSDAGPLPESNRRRRTWLWVLLGILGACLLVCIGLLVWGNTIGEGTISNLATRAASEATAKAGP